jgi:hypothetical protein
MYSWHDVAARTERVYTLISGADPSGDLLLNRMSRYYACGPWAGKLFCGVALLDYVFWRLLEWWAVRTPKVASFACFCTFLFSQHESPFGGGHYWEVTVFQRLTERKSIPKCLPRYRGRYELLHFFKTVLLVESRINQTSHDRQPVDLVSWEIVCAGTLATYGSSSVM